MLDRRVSAFSATVLLLLATLTLAFPREGLAQGPSVPIRDVENPARQPFQQELQIVVQAGTNGASQTFTVPAGRRLVIEYLAATVAVFPGQKAHLRITTTVGGAIASYDPPLSALGTWATGFDVFGVSQVVRIYADPGSTVAVVVGSDGGNFPGTIGELVTLSGYLVTL